MAKNTHTIDINSGRRTAEAKHDEPLFFALDRSGIHLPSACGGRGICGLCRTRVLSGGGDVNDIERQHLSEAEVAAGVRLSCQLRVRGDLSTEVAESVLKARRFKASVAGKRRLTYDMVEVRFELDEAVSVADKPGQFIRLEVPQEGGPVHRAYSISSLASEKGVVETVVRLVPDGVGSLYVHRLEAGDPVVFMGPYGEFELSQDPEVAVVCVGGGSGVSPIKNLIYSIYERWPERECWLFFGCRSSRDVFYYEEFRELAREHPSFRVVYGLSEPEEGTDWDGETGFIHLSVEKLLEKSTAARQAFLSGPPPMIEAAMKVLEGKGIGRKDMYYDRF
ncbi:MAG: 2Fe-2S iron-sulfur cluster binding domain-containing protein [Candidatus Eisenbacteria bacterium]